MAQRKSILWRLAGKGLSRQHFYQALFLPKYDDDDKVGQSVVQSVTQLNSDKKCIEFFVIKICFTSYIIIIRGQMAP